MTSEHVTAQKDKVLYNSYTMLVRKLKDCLSEKLPILNSLPEETQQLIGEIATIVNSNAITAKKTIDYLNQSQEEK